MSCGTTIWNCATCGETCTSPACGDCAQGGNSVAHEAQGVVLPALRAETSYADW